MQHLLIVLMNSSLFTAIFSTLFQDIKPLLKALILGGCVVTVMAQADDEEAIMKDFLDMSLEELLEVPIITSVSKKPQRLTDAAAAIYVLTYEDIRRSGATTIADALRMVPGIQVAQINSHAWAVTARGFNRFYASKLLVLVDGRSVYTPEFSGVYWDSVDLVLEDIQRIEVIRGPGGTLWGANAVNGIINIITKEAIDTQETLVKFGTGTEERGNVSIRYGGASEDEETFYRIYAKGRKHDEFEGEDSDAWSRIQSGFRADTRISSKDYVTLQGDIYKSEHDDLNWLTLQSGETDTQGANVLAKWEHLEGNSSFSLKAYYDYYQLELPLLTTTNHTFDLDMQHRTYLGNNHELVWGLGYRRVNNEISEEPLIRFNPAKRTSDLFSAFIQDEVNLVADRVDMVVGTKLEHNDDTGFEIQPSIKLLWTASETNTVWAAISRAVRTPSRSDTGLLINIPVPPELNPFFPTPLVNTSVGNPDIDSEELLAYEIGLRKSFTKNFSLDIATFYNEYDNLITSVVSQFVDPLNQQIVNQTFAESNSTGETYGIEVSTQWVLSEDWQLYADCTYLQVQLHSAEGVVTRNEDRENFTPHHQLSFRSNWDINDEWELDAWLRYADNLPSEILGGVDSYTTLDLRVGWHPRNNLEVSIVGRNLLDNQHQEFGPETLYPFNTEIERSIYAEIKWGF